MRILPIPIRSDNYMYLVVEQQRSSESATTISEAKLKALLVDPADPKALEKAHAAAGQANIDVDIVGVLTTHHHGDHAGGNDIIVSNIFVKLVDIIDAGNGRPRHYRRYQFMVEVHEYKEQIILSRMKKRSHSVIL
jgi:glyoxylase-like metal-dependent hydrolase (beta-lactamase superfamily II)